MYVNVHVHLYFTLLFFSSIVAIFEILSPLQISLLRFSPLCKSHLIFIYAHLFLFLYKWPHLRFLSLFNLIFHNLTSSPFLPWMQYVCLCLMYAFHILIISYTTSSGFHNSTFNYYTSSFTHNTFSYPFLSFYWTFTQQA